MSLEQLMQMRVDTVYGASKYEQKVSVAGVTSVREELGFWKVTGTLTNEAERPCRFPQAVIAFYGADGCSLAWHWSRTAQTAARGWRF